MRTTVAQLLLAFLARGSAAIARSSAHVNFKDVNRLTLLLLKNPRRANPGGTARWSITIVLGAWGLGAWGWGLGTGAGGWGTQDERFYRPAACSALLIHPLRIAL